MAPTIGVNLRVTGHCNQGGRKYMEDAFVVAYQQSEDEKDLEYAYFGIFDGHGGKEAALFAKEHLMGYIVNQKNFWSDNDDMVLKAIKEGFMTTHLAMWKELGKWPKTMSGLPSTSGTTSSVAFIRRGKLFVGHVGDSKIVLGYQKSGSRSWLAQSLTKDHKPESPREKKRILNVGGLVLSKAGVERVVWNRPCIGHKGPIRRSTHFDQIPFLAVARSLGDLWSYNYLKREFVVSPEPDVNVFNLDPRYDRCIILGSDGLWNMVSPDVSVRLVQGAEEENEQMILEGGGATGVGKPSNNPSKLLVDKALGLWFNYRMRADNTSVVTVLLDPPGPPKSEVLLRQKILQKLRPRDEQAGELENVASAPGETDCEDVDKGKSTKKSDGVLSDTSDDSLTKEKKRLPNVFETKLTNLPKPVVLSPHRVHRKSSPSPDKTKTESEPGEEMPSTTRAQQEGGSLPKELGGVVPSDQSPDARRDVIENPESDISARAALETKSRIIARDANENDSSSSSLIKENICESSKCPNIDPHKEAGRTHLSEVDNIVKMDREDRSPPDHSKASPCTARENKEELGLDERKKLAEGKVSTMALKRRRTDEPETSSPPKHLKLSGCSWTRDSLSNCQVTAVRELAHNTRSQQRSRKVKV